jgi:hypothetical protein
MKLGVVRSESQSFDEVPSAFLRITGCRDIARASIPQRARFQVISGRELEKRYRALPVFAT